MQILLDILQEPWAIRALIASSLVGIMCGVLGCFIVLRNMSLVGDALAHAILPGVVVAYVVVGYSALGFFTGSVLAGLVTAAAITWIQHRVKTKNDAAIGIVFTAMFSLGVIGISRISKNEGVHLDLKDFLFGNVLGVADTDLVLTALVTGYVLLSVIVFYRYLFATTFQAIVAETMGISVKLVHYYLMLLLSFAVVASLQTVGVILVVAMLITPAATALLLSARLQRVLVLAGAIGLISAVVGLVAAIVLETTPGPAMAVTATLIYLCTVVLAPRKGLMARARHRRQLRYRIQREDILKGAYRLQTENELTPEQLRAQLPMSDRLWRWHLRRLRRRRLLDGRQLSLTPEGMRLARRLVRAHRLWETYLVDQVGLTADQIHNEAEHYEHLLSEDLLDQVDHTLGYPEQDPHGSPIPAKTDVATRDLADLRVGESSRIGRRQASDEVSAYLWQLGLTPLSEVTLLEVEPDALHVRANDQEHRIPLLIARRILLLPTAF